jgi:hypothetical protein
MLSEPILVKIQILPQAEQRIFSASGAPEDVPVKVEAIVDRSWRLRIWFRCNWVWCRRALY